MKLTINRPHVLVFTWMILNFIINETALLFNLAFNLEYRITTDSYLTNLKYIFIQTLIYGIISLFAKAVWKTEKQLLFIIFQTIIFHAILFLNIVRIENTFSFSTSFDNFGLKYLFLNSTELTFLFNEIFPNYGIYDGGVYMPDSISIFYISHIVIPIFYFILLGWLTTKTINLLTYHETK